MRRTSHLRLRALQACSLAALALAAAGPAMAANTIKLDVTGSGNGVKTLSINQDATNHTNTITSDGTAGGGQLTVLGKWKTISISQTGFGNVLKTVSGITGDTASTDANLSLTYISAATGGKNIHSLSIGGTTAPTDAAVTVSMTNNDAVNAANNTLTDVLDGTSLGYTLDLVGANNTISNTIAATGAVTLNEIVHGGTSASGNTVTNSITGADSASVTLAVYSNGNTITNTSDGAGDKTISITLPSGGASGNTISNNFTGGTGAQSSSLLVTGVTSRINFGLIASGATTTSSVTLADVVGAAGAAAKLALSQTGANANLTLAVNGGGFAMGSSLSGGAGVLITQASPGAVLNANINAVADAYTYSISQ